MHLGALAAALLLGPACGGTQRPAKAAKKIFYLNSYHESYGTSPQILAGIRESLAGKNVQLHVFYLDAKRLRAEDQLAAKVTEALAQMRKFGPDLVIASDDDAVKRVVVPHLKGRHTPVVFCGVNWSAEPYGLPAGNVTGMVEVVPVAKTIRTVKTHYPQVKKLFVLSENSVSEKKNRQFLDATFRRLGLETEYGLVDDFSAWKDAFRRANREADLIYLPTNGAIQGWHEAEARQFVGQHLRKPVIACDDFMMPYAVLGLTKIAKEQGQWAGQTAWQVLGGKAPARVPPARNRQTQAWFNPALARKLRFTPDSAFMQAANLIPADL